MTSAINDEWRVDLILDRLPGGVLATALELYAETTTPEIYAYKNFNNKTRFKILRSWRGIFNEATKTAEYLDAYIKLNLFTETDTEDSFGTIGTMIKNTLLLVRWTTATANQPTFEGITRVVSLRDAS